MTHTTLPDYIAAAMARARFETLPDDNSYHGYIPGFESVHANASTQEECRTLLESALEEWLLLRIARHKDTPVLDGIALDASDFGSEKVGECRPGALEPRQTFTPESSTPASSAS